MFNTRGGSINGTDKKDRHEKLTTTSFGTTDRGPHTLLVIALASALIVSDAVGVAVPLSTLVAGLTLGVLVVGLPHGGLDQRVGLRLLKNFRPLVAWILFVVAYLAVAGIVIMGWFLEPRFTILSFFGLAAWHFGLEEESRPFTTPISRLAMIARGGMVIWIPAYFQGQSVSDLLTIIFPSGSLDIAQQVVADIQFIAPAMLILLAYDAICRREPAEKLSIGSINIPFHQLRIATFALLFATASPLISFGVYFCCWHSIIGLANLRRQFSLTTTELATKLFPISSAAIVLFLIGFAISRIENPFTPAMLQTMFIGLSALAVPHLLLHVISDIHRLDSNGMSR
ncbi:MAG: hypothetical protein CMJ77_02675 [Planctomycetaceae bacterium]|nr:hypothetical protein [Planctomycetaceae bacterium]